MFDKNLVKVYADQQFTSTALVRHQGMVVAFAVGADRQIYYSVLGLDEADRERGALDAAYWSNDPRVLPFPTEIVDVNADRPVTQVMPTVEKSSGTEIKPEALLPGESDPFLSTTARLSSTSPIQVISDGRFVLVFRQAVAPGSAGCVFALAGGGFSADLARTDYAQVDGGKVPLTDGSLLCDRFVLVGSELKPVVEVRYQRSRSRISPAAGGDTLGTRDMEGRQFYEPTQKLSFVRKITSGMFTVLLLPTSVQGVMRWQLFSVDTASGRVLSYNLEQSSDGLFNVKGTQLYTSPDPKFVSSVLERAPGIDPNTKLPLVPVRRPSGAASGGRVNNAVRFDAAKQASGVTWGSLYTPVPAGPYAVEMWIKPKIPTGTLLGRYDKSMNAVMYLGLDSGGKLVFFHGGNTLTSSVPVPMGTYAHVAAVFDGSAMRLFLNGQAVGTLSATAGVEAVTQVIVGGRLVAKTMQDPFTGEIDEVRMWKIARTDFTDRERRLTGAEPGLFALYPFDEGYGTTVRDLSGNQPDGRMGTGAQWVGSDAPLYDGPGLVRSSFAFAGRKAEPGLTAALYYQQERSATGYKDEATQEKRQARVLLVCKTSGPAPQGGSADRTYVAALDFAVSKEGRLATPPGDITLSPIGKPDPTADATKLRQAEAAVTAARGTLYADRALVQDAKANLERFSAIDRELYGGVPGFSLSTLNARFALVRPNEIAYERSLLAERDLLTKRILLQEAARKRLGADEAALAKAQNDLAALSGGLLGGAEAVLPMPSVSVDESGLSVFGGLLLFAWTTDAPSLLDSSTGEVAMYFRGGDGRFFAAYYATLVSPAVKQIVLADKTLVRLISRDPVMNLADFSVTVNADGPGRNKVVVSRGAVTETFPAVPDRADAFAAVLNGSPQGSDVGAVASIQDRTVVLRDPIATWIAPGSAIRIGTQYRTVEQSQAGSAQITLKTGGLTAVAGAPVRTVVYDYTQASSTAVGVSLAQGSQIVGVDAGMATGPLPSGTATDLSAALVPRWHGDSPGRAFSFDAAASQRLELPSSASLSKLSAPGDLTVEAWVYPTSVNGPARILHAYQDQVVKYSLGLDKATLTPSGQLGYTLLGCVNDQFVRGTEAFPLNEWGHVAMAFEQGWAMGMNGAAYLEAGGPGGLDLVDELTIEAFVKLDSVGTVQGLVGKGAVGAGTNNAVPYSFYVDADGQLAFTFEGGSGGAGKQLTYQSGVKLAAGTFTKVAVTRRNRTAPATGVEICFYIDGNPVGNVTPYTGARPIGNDESVQLGRHRIGKTAYGLRGALSEVRIWTVARAADQIGVPITAKANGLAAWWTFPEASGSETADGCGTYPATLRGVVRVRTPDPAGNRFTFYRNGVPTLAALVPASDPMMRTRSSRSSHLAVGARLLMSGAYGEGFTGDLDEIRVWRTARSQEQVLDNMFGKVRGDRQDLIAYYPFDIDSTVAGAAVRDGGLGGNDLVQPASPPKIVLSSAPISTDTAQVRAVLTAVPTPFHALTAATPAATEYADVQRVVRGGLIGVMKRAYTYLDGIKWTLVTGYKVGELTTTWVGQAQFAPQLIGYIEGAPPVPSENLIAGTADDYAEASSIAFVQADTVTNTLASNKVDSTDFAAKLKFTWSIAEDTWSVQAPLGVGTAKPLVAAKKDIDLNFELKYSNSWTNETQVSQGTAVTRTSRVDLTGGWENADSPLNPTAGQRYVPANTGFAVVQSDTADLYALRLAHTGALVAYRMLPSPDIPRDWNLIPFPINPRYTKQGTLDGLVGFAEKGSAKELQPFADPSFPNAGDGGEYSYFRPREAYRIKNRITREQQQLQGYYDSASTETHVPDPTKGQAAKVLNGMMGGTGADLKPIQESEAGREAIKAASRRNIVNTYVWTAAGGFFAESTGTTDQVTQVTAGSYSVSGSFSQAGMFDTKFVNVGFRAGYEVSMGGGSTVTRTKTQDATRTYSLDVTCKPGRKLQKMDPTTSKPMFDADNKPVLVPGRVDAYRFMSFYLDTTTDNFEDFYGKVVDPEWLDRSKDANALALVRARQTDRKPPCWRILHRVTFVSRVLSPTPPALPSLERTMRLQNIPSPYAFIKQLEPYLGAAVNDRTELTTRTGTILAQHFPAFLPYTNEVVALLANYYQVTETPSVAQAAPIPGRAYIVAAHVEKLVDIVGANSADGVRVDLWDWNSRDNQKFQIDPVGGGYYKLVAKFSGRALTVDSLQTTDGAAIVQWDWNNSDWQKFLIEPVGGGFYKFTAKHSGKVITVTNGGTDNGAKLEQRTWADLPHQKFQLRAINDAAW